jgi:hypothetical protein
VQPPENFDGLNFHQHRAHSLYQLARIVRTLTVTSAASLRSIPWQGIAGNAIPATSSPFPCPCLPARSAVLAQVVGLDPLRTLSRSRPSRSNLAPGLPVTVDPVPGASLASDVPMIPGCTRPKRLKPLDITDTHGSVYGHWQEGRSGTRW